MLKITDNKIYYKDENGDITYNKDEFSAHSIFPVRNGYVVVHDDDGLIMFGLFSIQKCTGPNYEQEWLALVYEGYGFGGVLRECRHTWFRDEGYLFYMDGIQLAESFKVLSKWFDDMYVD